jgi:tRNA A58 N-methylase Trm61
MSDFVEQLRLAEKAAEDIYFSKVDQELIEALHKRMRAEKESYRPSTEARAVCRLVIT